MKLKEIQKMIAEAIDAEKAAEKAVDGAYPEWGFEANPKDYAILEAAAAIIKAAKAADKEAQSVLRTCAEIAIGDRLGAFSRAPAEMCLGMERQRLREYVALLDPVNNAEDADRFEAVILGLARYFGADDVEEILFGEEADDLQKSCDDISEATPLVPGVLTDPLDFLYN